MTSSYPKILAVITARGGSKRVPRKNVRQLAGKPLIEWSIDAAKAQGDHLFDVVVSTDDKEIAEISRQAGASVPFMRPSELAGDEAKSLPVVQHAVNFVEARSGCTMDWILLLQPTSPLRSAADIEQAISLALNSSECDSVVSVCRMVHHHPIFAKKVDESGHLVPFMLEEPEGLRRQDVEPEAFMRNGALYLTRRDILMTQGSIYGRIIIPYLMPDERSVDIDAEVDFLLAEALLRPPT